MKALGAICLGLSLAGCTEPPKMAQMEQAIAGLADLHTWDPALKGKGQYAYDAIMSWGPEIHPALVSHLTDETPTAIYHSTFNITVTVSDVCFMMLLELMNLKWQAFSDDGIFISSQLPNPIFCIRWKDRETRLRVKAHFAKLLSQP